MKLYIYEYVGGITDNYHDGGGLVIITDRDPADVWREHVESLSKGSGLYPESLSADALKSDKPADLVVDIDDRVSERIIIFPDSGCC